MNCIEREMVYGDDIIYHLTEDETVLINGNQIQIIDTDLQDDAIALGKIEYGHGNNGDERQLEGAKYKNIIFTNCLGPLFVKNPWYTEKLIRLAMQVKGIKIEKMINSTDYALEQKSMECIQKYTQKKISQ